MITLNKHEVSAKIKERYASIIYSFDFESMNENGSNELKFEITIDPQAFISSFEANIDGQIFHGITKEKQTAAKEYSAAKQKNENAILISKPYDNIQNVFQIKTNIDAKSKILLSITIEQYLQKRFNFNQLNIQILRDFTKYCITKKYQFIPFKLEICDKSGIYDIHLPEDLIIIDDKTMDKLNQNYVINGKLKDTATNEFILKYKIKGEQNDSYILYDNKTNTFCHIISDIITDSITNAEDNINEGDNDDIIHENNILIPRRVIFVIDKSGSMRGIKWQNTISATIMALKRLRNGYDRYCLMFFSNVIEIYPDNKGFVLTDDTNTSDAILYLQNQRAQGGTNINDALLKAVELIKNDIYLVDKDNNSNLFMNQIVFITDGEPNSGETNTKQIINNVQNVNNLRDIDKYYSKISICSFGVGRDGNDSLWTKDLNHSFLKLLSVNNYGFYKRIKQTTADTVLNEYFNILSKPILSNINIKYNDKNIDNLTKTSFNTLYSGNDLIICGKIKNITQNDEYNVNLTISAITGKRIKQNDTSNTITAINICKEMQINVSNTDNNKNLDRIWAYLKLQQLANNKLMYYNDMIESDDDEKKNEDSLPLSLAMQYKFVTPWTSMIVVKKKEEQELQKDEEENEEEEDEDEEKEEKKQISQPLPSTSESGRVWGYTFDRGNVQAFKQYKASSSSNNTNNAERDFYKTFWIESGKIGEGAFSRVRTINRKSDRKEFDLKMVKIKGKSEDEIKACKLEIDILKKCNHPNIVDLESSVHTKKRIYIVIERCNGGNIIERIINNKNWSEQLTINVIKQIVSGLDHLHSLGFVHKDLKPENLMYLTNDNDSIIKICELGCDADCNNGLTANYSAPEIISSLQYDESADIWSLGVIIYILLCGFPPFFDATNTSNNLYELIKSCKYSFPSPFWDKISKNAKDLIANLLVNDRKNRLTAKQVLNHEWIKNDNENQAFGIEYIKQISHWENIRTSTEFEIGNEFQSFPKQQFRLYYNEK